MPRYVILSHDHPSPHFDLMLEAGESLRTWRLAEALEPGRAVGAESIAPHRLSYLDYEGPVGGGRGSVSRWDAGTFSWIEDRAERICVAMKGRRLIGLTTLVAAGPQWAALFAVDGHG